MAFMGTIIECFICLIDKIYLTFSKRKKETFSERVHFFSFAVSNCSAMGNVSTTPVNTTSFQRTPQVTVIIYTCRCCF